MSFISIFLTLLPLYLIVLCAYLVGKATKIDPKGVADMVIYFVSPLVVFGALLNIEFEPSHLAYPLGFMLIASVVSFSGLALAKTVFKSQRAAYLMGGAAGQANLGYFGYPVAIALFGVHKAEAYMLVTVGSLLFETSLGYYLMARGNFSMQDSLKKLVKLPVFYAIFLAFVLRAVGVDGVPEMFSNVYGYFRGAYVILGMSLIGLALAAVSKFSVGPRFLGVGMVVRFVLWPLVTFALVMVDSHFTHFLLVDHYQFFMLVAIAPFAANTVAYATQLGVYPDKAAMLVLLSTLVALIAVPVVFTLFPVH